MTRRTQKIGPAAALCVALAGAASAQQDARVIARFTFDDASPGNAPGLPAGTLQGATQAEGHQGKALAFEDWSVRDYLKPNPAQAMRLMVPHDPRLNPAPPFSITAWIYATADPIYYGGIVEKGRGFGGSYRLLLLRGLRVAGSVGAKNATIRSADPLTLNTWHELRLVASATSLQLYVDGKKVAEGPLPGGSQPAAKDDLVIGDRFTGRIDDVSIAAGS